MLGDNFQGVKKVTSLADEKTHDHNGHVMRIRIFLFGGYLDSVMTKQAVSERDDDNSKNSR